MTFIRNKKGQMAILIALSFGLLFLLIAMVINIGFLVTAKINLQNAVDLAAYSGAAQQARYLSEIGKWNYEMRRNYKAMAFDYVVALNGEMKATKPGPDTDYKKYMTLGTDETGGIPSVCIALQRQLKKTDPQFTLNTMCQTLSTVDMQNSLNNVFNFYSSSYTAQMSLCATGGTPACLAQQTAAVAATNSVTATVSQYQQLQNISKNYEPQKDYNYNRRLIAWMLHDYRNMQARIRGVHFGNIKIGGRRELIKDPSPIIFENSPISVAAKVINGYTKLDGQPASAGNILALSSNQELLKNPIHNAAYGSFKRNLIQALSNNANLYNIVPNSPTGSAPQQNTMAGGCGNQCQEFTGPYIRLDNHDVNFYIAYTSVKSVSTTSFSAIPEASLVTNFPIGIAKDARVWTYYAVIGTASTKEIPFNVFFGGQNTSQDVNLVAVSAARPFGSRIGPYIDDKCENLFKGTGGNKSTCVSENGLDPLYPFEESNINTKTMVTNFSVNNETTKRLGVKLCVSRNEYSPSQNPSGLPGASDDKYHSMEYQITAGATKGRNRLFTQQNDKTKDDGFDSLPSDPYYENMSPPVHPLGTQNSIIAWQGINAPKTGLGTAKIDNYEAYLEKYANPMVVHGFNQLNNRKSSNADYKVYVFRYPNVNPSSPDSWDIGGLTLGNDLNNRMEKAFANAMAVNQFEVLRYIIPYKNKNDTGNGALKDVMNYMASDQNDNAYGGEKNRDIIMGLGNIPISNQSGPDSAMIKDESADPWKTGSGNISAESFAAWRTGMRGYRVKLVNIQDLISNNSNNIQNKLNSSYKLPDQAVTVDLSKINY